MRIEIEIDGKAAAIQGADIGALSSDIKSELDEFSKHLGADEPKRTEKRPEGGAQGEIELIQFLVELAKEPAAIKAAISSVVYAINEIANARSKSGPQEDTEKKSVKMKVLGKEVVLPATVAVIKQFIEDLTKDD